MKILDKLGRYDGLDLSNLAGVEMAFRRAQLIEYFYSERGPGEGKAVAKARRRTRRRRGGSIRWRPRSSLGRTRSWTMCLGRWSERPPS